MYVSKIYKMNSFLLGHVAQSVGPEFSHQRLNPGHSKEKIPNHWTARELPEGMCFLDVNAAKMNFLANL